MAELPDRIAEVFKGRTIFLTGATGFLGKALIEKLLRVTDVGRMYLLIRKKKGKSPNERFQDIFNNVLFKPLIEQKPDVIKKCTPVFGDVTEIDLGLSKEDREMLKNEVDFIYHSAATTKFDDTLRAAVIMNTRGTKFMLDLAEECKHLKLFMHVSTAYIFPKEDVIYEKPYDPPANPHEVLNSINWINEDNFGNLTKNLLEDIPNSYTFSKSLAEALVYEKIGKIPLIIARPAVVIPTYSDPFPGWCNNLQGPMGLFVGGGKGLIRSMCVEGNAHANFVPVDCTVAGILSASWNYVNVKNSPNIYNMCVPECDIIISWKEIMQIGHDVINKRVPFNGILWYPDGSMTRSKLLNKINIVLFQIIPALLIDLLLIILGYKPVLYAIQMRILKGVEMFEYYTVKKWNFSTKNIEDLRKNLNARERQIYMLENAAIDVKSYLTDCILFVRRNILKETDDMLPAAHRNMKIMYVLDKVCKIIFFAWIAYYMYKLVLVPVFNLERI